MELMDLEVITYPIDEITGAILAGGQAERMGGKDKGLVKINGRPMIEYALDALTPQVAKVVINANRNIPTYSHYGVPVIQDTLADYQGPLAGMASVLAEATTPYIMIVPCDSPLIPKDLVKRMYSTLRRESADLCVAHDGKRTQPVFSLLTRGLLPSLREFLDTGDRKIDRWFGNHQIAYADFSDAPDTFMNINRPEDCNQLADLLPHQQVD